MSFQDEHMFEPWLSWGDVPDESKAAILAGCEPFRSAITLAPTDTLYDAFEKILAARK